MSAPLIRCQYITAGGDEIGSAVLLQDTGPFLESHAIDEEFYKIFLHQGNTIMIQAASLDCSMLAIDMIGPDGETILTPTYHEVLNPGDPGANPGSRHYFYNFTAVEDGEHYIRVEDHLGQGYYTLYHHPFTSFETYSPYITVTSPDPSTSGGVSLAWTAHPDATGYHVFHDTAPITGVSGMTPIANVTSGSYSTTIVENGLHYFAVLAFNGTHNSSLSNCKSVTIAIPGVPGQVTGLVVTPGNGHVNLTWTAPVEDGGAPVTGYIVRWSMDNTTFAEIEVGNVTAFHHVGLTNGQPYQYTVAAVNEVGRGPASSVASATPAAPPPVIPGFDAWIVVLVSIMAMLAIASRSHGGRERHRHDELG